ncbi:MAG: hypothetical protein ACI8RD_005255 [Bacillariaceae sp.]|jgi:hypothetical protein
MAKFQISNALPAILHRILWIAEKHCVIKDKKPICVLG